MKRLAYAFLAICLTYCTAQAQCGIHNTAFKSGETLRYDLYFNWKFVWLKVGNAHMNITSTQYEGKPAFKAFLITRGTPTADRYFVMRDTLTTYVDLALNPLFYTKCALEGDAYTVDKIKYSYKKGKAHVTQQHSNKHGALTTNQYESNMCIYDMISMLLRARSLDASQYKVGSRIAFMMADGKKCQTQNIVFKGKETFKVENSKTKYRCLVFSYVENEDGKEKEIVTFYITDDDNHIPVRLDMNLNFGTAKAYLTGMTGIRNPIRARVK